MSNYYLIEEGELLSILEGYYRDNEMSEPYRRAQAAIKTNVFLPCPNYISEYLIDAAHRRKWGEPCDNLS